MSILVCSFCILQNSDWRGFICNLKIYTLVRKAIAPNAVNCEGIPSFTGSSPIALFNGFADSTGKL
jgi:hypothetical protein